MYETADSFPLGDSFSVELIPSGTPGIIGDWLALYEQLVFTVSNYQPIFGTVSGADRYFSEQLYGQFWECTTLVRKQQALITATRVINMLRFAGQKTDPAQPLEWPRSSIVFWRNNGQFAYIDGITPISPLPPPPPVLYGTPVEVEQATYEEALALLKGADPETEYAGSFVTSQVFGKVRTDYDSRTVGQHTIAGLASRKAWLLLRSFLNDSKAIRLRRA